jgi:effector-binding domain-containing protein
MSAGIGIHREKEPIRLYLTSPKLVAFTSFKNIQEVGKRILMVRNWINEYQIQEIGAPSCVFSPSLEVQCEIASLPRIDATPNTGEVGIKWVQAEWVASIFHQGDTETLEESLALLKNAVLDKGFTACGPTREVYLFEVCQPKSRWVTEIQIPIIEHKRRKLTAKCKLSQPVMKV